MSFIPYIDLVIVINTNPSVKDEAQAFSKATASAIASLHQVKHFGGRE